MVTMTQLVNKERITKSVSDKNLEMLRTLKSAIWQSGKRQFGKWVKVLHIGSIVYEEGYSIQSFLS